jgi:hypothetical protein
MIKRKHDHDWVSIKDELESRIKDWLALVENIEQFKKIIDENYYQYQYLVKYLDNEDLLKSDLKVKSPCHHVDKDV